MVGEVKREMTRTLNSSNRKMSEIMRIIVQKIKILGLKHTVAASSKTFYEIVLENYHPTRTPIETILFHQPHKLGEELVGSRAT